jgi:hypothetical protein
VSKHELIDAYIEHRISRRAFIQGLTALGVSSGIAASYAVALQPASAATCEFYDNPNDFYDFYDLYCTGSGGDNNSGGNNSGGSQPDGSQGGTGPTDDDQNEDGQKKRKRRKRKGKKKKN